MSRLKIGKLEEKVQCFPLKKLLGSSGILKVVYFGFKTADFVKKSEAVTHRSQLNRQRCLD